MLLSGIILIIGFVLLIVGSDAFVNGATALARRWHVSEFLIGLTIVAMGTSAPEFAISMASVFNNSSTVAVGNILGSNISNVLLILGASAVVYPLAARRKTMYYEIPFIIFIMALLLWFGYAFGGITRMSALVLFILFILYMVYLCKISSETNKTQIKDIKKMSGFMIILNIMLGLCALIIGSNFTVGAAVDIAQYFNMSERIIGLTIIAIGTSLPELAVGITAALKRKADLIIGNIIGTNIFNTLFILGITGLIQPLSFESGFIFDSAVALLVAGILWVCALSKSCLTRAHGVLFLLLYTIYLLYLILV